MKTILAAVLLAAAGVAAITAADSSLSKQQLTALLDCSGQLTRTLDQLARDAVSEDNATAQNAIRILRARGPEGLRALLEAHAETLKQHATANPLSTTKTPDEAWLRLKTALDGVGQQHDCHASKLYWYTDFEQAKAAAKASAKPILSLRLLGKLDEEFSCANSRFFRTTLYANAKVARQLNENFILHWKSVRPVPKVTIDFGDGRKLERTITGNSIHYVMDSDGRVIDALPGLYGAQTFLRELNRTKEMFNQCSALEGEKCGQVLREFHRMRAAALKADLASDLEAIKVRPELPGATSTILPSSLSATPALVQAGSPPAKTAMRLTAGKGAVEAPLLRATLPGAGAQAALETQPDGEIWQKIAALHVEAGRLDEGSKALIRAKNPTAFSAGRRTTSKAFVEDPLLRQIRNLERSISEDTVRNEYLFHTKIHDWLASGGAPADVDKLNAKVYAELFLTPDSDPWLGLLPNDTYAALENDGVILTTKH